MDSNTSEFWQWYVVFSAIWGAVTGAIGARRGGIGFLWFLVGAVLGPLALPLPFLFAGQPCPFCRKSISAAASICPFCRSDLSTDEIKEHQERLSSENQKVTLVIAIALAGFLAYAFFRNR